MTTPSYEAVYAELEQTIADLERGDVPLDEALRLYEHGVRLSTRCQAMLDAAELRVQQLIDGALVPLE